MENNFYISSYCAIKQNAVYLNGSEVFSTDETELKPFLKAAYKNLNLNYAKFFKMDNLSKLSLLATEYILRNIEEFDKDMAIVFSNNASSLETDRIHQESIEDATNYFPSPAVFVYTLPNIGIGEISIKYQLQGENAFFVFDEFNAEVLYNYQNILLQTKKCEQILAGWVNVDSNTYEAFIYLISPKGSIEHNIENLDKLYNN